MPNCPFCSKPIQIEQESYESFLVICNESACEPFYLEKGYSGKTPELALEQFQGFLKELELGGQMWGSKIQAGLGDD